VSDTVVVYGLHAVRVLLERHPERVRALWLQQGREDARLAGLRALATERRIRIGSRTTAELAGMAGEGVHQGIVAEVEPSPAQTEHDLEDVVRTAGPDVLLLVLDGVQDPHNLGA
jgi:23S rRNA (guanosine2251-2'-O)-methyltransferase